MLQLKSQLAAKNEQIAAVNKQRKEEADAAQSESERKLTIVSQAFEEEQSSLTQRLEEAQKQREAAEVDNREFNRVHLEHWQMKAGTGKMEETLKQHYAKLELKDHEDYGRPLPAAQQTTPYFVREFGALQFYQAKDLGMNVEKHFLLISRCKAFDDGEPSLLMEQAITKEGRVRICTLNVHFCA